MALEANFILSSPLLNSLTLSANSHQQRNHSCSSASPASSLLLGWLNSNGFYRRSHHYPQSIRASLKTLGGEAIDDEIRQTFIKERQSDADFISKVSDLLWLGVAFKLPDTDPSILQENFQLSDKGLETEGIGGFLQLTKTQEWVSGDSVAPLNRKLVAKDRQNEGEKRKKLNLLKYDAIKRELLLLTVGIGAGCFIYCLIGFSFEAAMSYAAGVFFSCLYLLLLYYHTDNLSREAVPKIFMQKKLKKIGIRSEDLKDSFEKTLYGSTMALSSPRLVIPATIYGIWILSQHTLQNINFQIVPAMLGFFAYKAAALVQVYRDNEDLQLILPDSDEN